MDLSAPRILIVRLSAIGDTVLSVPVLCALRERFPRATIGWIVERTSAPLLRGHADLDHLIVVPRGWLKSPKVVWETVRRTAGVWIRHQFGSAGIDEERVDGTAVGSQAATRIYAVRI